MIKKRGKMKRLHKQVVRVIASHRRLSTWITAILFSVSCIAMFYTSVPLVLALYFGFSLGALLRLITYKTGKIPFIMIDKTWDGIKKRLKKKYPEENEEELYKRMSLNLAATYLTVLLFAFPVWIICEILAFV